MRSKKVNNHHRVISSLCTLHELNIVPILPSSHFYLQKHSLSAVSELDKPKKFNTGTKFLRPKTTSNIKQVICQICLIFKCIKNKK